MAVPSVMADLSVTANNNSPAGSESPISTDDFHRAIQAILRHTNAKGADIASATTTDIGAATGEFVDVTGTTTITGLGTIAAGIERTVRFTGALTLTHNGTSLILPGAANITTAANDRAVFRSLGSGNWICIVYQKTDGSALVSPLPISDGTAVVKGSSDPTKLVRIEADGLTTATTRVLTAPDRNIYLVGAQDLAVGTYKNLIITNNSGTPNSQLDVDADFVLLKDSSGVSYPAATVNLTINIAASGANGLDTGSEANSTWYYAYVIYNPTTDTVAGLLSASATAPTMPDDYTYSSGALGAIYNSSGGDFIKYYQSGDEFWVGEVAATTTVPSGSYVSVSLALAVPPTAKAAKISGQWAYATSVSGVNYYAPSNADDLAQKDNITTGGGTAATLIGEHTIPLITAQTIYYKRTGTAAASGTLYCNGGKY